MVYLDNSSTTHKKPLSVLLSTFVAMTIDSVNIGRGGYRLTLRAEEKVYDTRSLFDKEFGVGSEDGVIFTSGCTMAINMALLGTVKEGKHIVATVYEHNSVLRTLDYMSKHYGITYTLVKPRSDGKVYSSDIEDSIMSNTYMIVTNHTSNVVGATVDIKAVGDIAKKHRLLYMVDGAQSVGHESIDMQKYNINILTIAGHKGLYAPQGIGVLLLHNVQVNPIVFGGTGTYSDSITQPTDYPSALESGTHNLCGIYGIYSGLKYVTKHKDKINEKIAKLTTKLIEGLKHIKGVKVYSNNVYSGVVSFNIKDMGSSDVSDILATRYHIATRSGLHCAPKVHEYYGTIRQGMVRASISYFNSSRDIEKLLRAVRSIASSDVV